MERVAGPGGVLAATVEDGTLAIECDGRTVLEPSPLGVASRAYPDDLAVRGRTDRTVEEQFETPRGKRREHRHRATEAVLDVGDGAALDVRVAPDGVAYRYRAALSDPRMVFGEASGACLPPDAVAWLHPFEAMHESTAVQVPATEAAGEFSPPGLFTTGEHWLLLAEAGGGDYHAARLTTDAGESLVRYAFPEAPVRVRDELVTPWRVAVVGDLGAVVESSLVPALAGAGDGGADADWSWVQPGRVAWSWWSETESGADPDRQREYVDYAAEQGWEYVLVDARWSAEWMPDLVAYADERGVGVLVWCHYADLVDGRTDRLDRWAEWGVAGVKVDFMANDDQGRVGFYERVAAAAAERGLVVNFHGSIVPRGLARRYPNVLTYEGVKGAEFYKSKTLAPAHNATLPFTRNAVGPMDYTPVAFENPHAHTTPGHELALAVVFESGLQHFADAAESYRARPAAESFLAAVPAAWDGTRFLGGYPGVEATLARRRGDQWFVGSVTAGPPRRVSVPIEFIDRPREGRLLRDGADGLAAEPVTLAPGTEFAVEVAENGGFALRLREPGSG